MKDIANKISGSCKVILGRIFLRLHLFDKFE